MTSRLTRRWSPVLLGLLALAAHAVPARGAGTIFLERCAAGCTYFPGFDDSRTNHSSLLNQTSNLPAFGQGDPAWAELLACVQRGFAPFDVAVTDVDPGTASHWEIVVAGSPGNIGQPPGTAGVSPYTCAVINNGVAYAFAAVHANMKDLCWTTVHETAHLFGLDHELLQRDPMTYLVGCMDKVFAFADASCGEATPRNCCLGAGPPTQNSATMVTAALGPAGHPAPLFLDGFSAFEDGADPANPDEVPSDCRWDGAIGAPVAGPALPELRSLRCGTETARAGRTD